MFKKIVKKTLLSTLFLLIFSPGIFCILLVLSMGLSMALYIPPDPVKVIERHFGIELPDGMEVLYNDYSQSFHGDFSQYTVFKLKYPPYKSFGVSQFKEARKEELGSIWVSGIPEEYLPVWEGFVAYNPSEGGWYRLPSGFILYYPSTYRLISFVYTA